jgi:hypothetical protein
VEAFFPMKRPNNSEPIADTGQICWSKLLTLHAQKYLRLLNLRLDVVVKDVTTGLSIIDAICKGEMI